MIKRMNLQALKQQWRIGYFLILITLFLFMTDGVAIGQQNGDNPFVRIGFPFLASVNLPMTIDDISQMIEVSRTLVEDSGIDIDQTRLNIDIDTSTSTVLGVAVFSKDWMSNGSKIISRVGRKPIWCEDFRDSSIISFCRSSVLSLVVVAVDGRKNDSFLRWKSGVAIVGGVAPDERVRRVTSFTSLTAVVYTKYIREFLVASGLNPVSAKIKKFSLTGHDRLGNEAAGCRVEIAVTPAEFKVCGNQMFTEISKGDKPTVVSSQGDLIITWKSFVEISEGAGVYASNTIVVPKALEDPEVKQWLRWYNSQNK